MLLVRNLEANSRVGHEAEPLRSGPSVRGRWRFTRKVHFAQGRMSAKHYGRTPYGQINTLVVQGPGCEWRKLEYFSDHFALAWRRLAAREKIGMIYNASVQRPTASVCSKQ